MRLKNKRVKKVKLSKLILIGVPILVVVALCGLVYAAIGIVSPGSLDYISPPANNTMQSFTSADCASMQTYNTVVLTDTRNNQDYRVRKMRDGKCWMIDNLKLATPGTSLTLTSANSNVSSNFTLPPNPVNTAATRVTNGVCDSSNSAGATGTTGNLTCDGSTSGTTGSPANTNFNFIAWSDPADPVNTTMSENCQPGAPGLDPNSLSGCGYLYNWFTATAGTGTYAISVDGTNATSSICPLGWTLPSAGTGTAATNNHFAVLNGAMLNGGAPVTTNSAATRANWRANGPFSGSYSGYWTTGFDSQGNLGYYWSSSANNATNARRLYFNYNGVLPGNSTTNKNYGTSVRCISL